MNWPSHFPKECPPADAITPAALVFRLVTTDPPSAEDFISHRLLYPARRFPDVCKACGLSVYTQRKDIEDMRKAIPGLRSKKIAEFMLGSKDGMIKATPSNANSHHTWWHDDANLVNLQIKIS